METRGAGLGRGIKQIWLQFLGTEGHTFPGILLATLWSYGSCQPRGKWSQLQFQWTALRNFAAGEVLWNGPVVSTFILADVFTLFQQELYELLLIFIYFLFLKLLQSFCCPRWYEISYILIHSISLFYIYVRTLVNIFNLVIQFFHFVNLHWVVYCFSFLSFSCIFLSRTYYFSVRFYGFNSVFFLIFLFYFLFLWLFAILSQVYLPTFTLII